MKRMVKNLNDEHRENQEGNELLSAEKFDLNDDFKISDDQDQNDYKEIDTLPGNNMDAVSRIHNLKFVWMWNKRYLTSKCQPTAC